MNQLESGNLDFGQVFIPSVTLSVPRLQQNASPFCLRLLITPISKAAAGDLKLCLHLNTVQNHTAGIPVPGKAGVAKQALLQCDDSQNDILMK